MGTEYAWFCDNRREWLDPGKLGYGMKFGQVVYSGWLIAVLAVTEWQGEQFRLISDSSDEMWTLTADDEWAKRDRSNQPAYTEVSIRTVTDALRWDGVPEEGLRFLARPLLGEVKAKTEPEEVLRASLRLKFPSVY